MNENTKTEKQVMDAHDLCRMIRGKRIRDKSADIVGYATSIRIALYGCTTVFMTVKQGTFGPSVRTALLSDIELLDEDFPDANSNIDFSQIDVTCKNPDLLGKMCRDKVSGFRGIAVAITINADELKVILQPRTQDDIRLPNCEVFNYLRLDCLEND